MLRSAASPPRQPANDDMLAASLFPYKPRFGFEMFELTLPPGYVLKSATHKADVTENVEMSSGEMELFLNGEWVSLELRLRFGLLQQIITMIIVTKLQAPTVFLDVIYYGGSTEPTN